MLRIRCAGCLPVDMAAMQSALADLSALKALFTGRDHFLPPGRLTWALIASSVGHDYIQFLYGKLRRNGQITTNLRTICVGSRRFAKRATIA